ncbi:hypothetical protein EHW59_15820, partial [Salinivibrio sp. VYel4]|nr:hypothetical protein [Salinivibrio sp. VYel4]
MKRIIRLISGNSLAQVVTIISMPVLTNLYTDSDFGQYSMFLAITSVLGMIVTLKLELLFLADHNNKSSVLNTCIIALFFVVFILSILFFINVQFEILDVFEDEYMYIYMILSMSGVG